MRSWDIAVLTSRSPSNATRPGDIRRRNRARAPPLACAGELFQFQGMPLPLLKGWHDYVGAALMQRFLAAPGMRIDFSAPEGEPALAAPDSLTWRIFKNPIALFAGGIGAVLLELAEPRVRT